MSPHLFDDFSLPRLVGGDSLQIHLFSDQAIFCFHHAAVEGLFQNFIDDRLENSWRSIDHPPLIFTSQLFKEGFRALANEITAFLSNDCQLEDSKLPADQVILELSLKEERLWILVHMGLLKPKEVYLKRFNTGGIRGSSPYDFIKDLLQNYADGGDVLIDFADKSENIPKALERIGMRESFKHLFFGQSRGTKVTFHGSRIGIPRDEKCRLFLEELDEIHQKAGCPEYPTT